MHSQDDSYGWQGRRGRHKERGRRRQEPPPGQADWQPPPPSGGQFHPDPAHHLHHRPPHHLDPRADPRSRDSMDPRSRDNTDISLSSAREDSNAAAAGDAWLERESDSRFVGCLFTLYLLANDSWWKIRLVLIISNTKSIVWILCSDWKRAHKKWVGEWVLTTS